MHRVKVQVTIYLHLVVRGLEGVSDHQENPLADDKHG